jgi:MFS family permease
MDAYDQAGRRRRPPRSSPLARALRWSGRQISGQVVEFVGGPARTRVVILLAAVLALSSADISTVGAAAPQMEAGLHIDNTKIGLLATVALLGGAVAVIPAGWVVDRFNRVRILAVTIVLWCLAGAYGAIAGSYTDLLVSRAVLGVLSAMAGPAVAALIGDFFASRERGKVYGYILSGEIAGTAFGFVVGGESASIISWQASFILLSIPGLFLARSLWRTLPEPRRGGQSRLAVGTVDLAEAVRAGSGPAREDEEDPAAEERELAYEAARARGIRPDPKLVLRTDPQRMSLLGAIRYILRIPTNVLLIISSALGYFFFSGLQSFATVFIRGHFHAGQTTATLVLGLLVIGALIGTLISGPLSDAFVRRGQVEARVWVPTVCYIGGGIALIPGLLAGSLSSAIWLVMIGSALIFAANPPLDSARLDIMPPGLWGRAESTRSFVRSIAQALAPLIFGAIADLVAGFEPHQAPVGTHIHYTVSSATGTGLQVAFLSMLVTLFAAGVVMARSAKTYPRDVATAGAAWPTAPARPDATTRLL